MFILGVTIGAIVGIFIMCVLQINRENKECLHCGKGPAAYCEKCFQDLISENIKLQAERDIQEVKVFKEKIKNPKVVFYEDTDSIKNICRICGGKINDDKDCLTICNHTYHDYCYNKHIPRID